MGLDIEVDDEVLKLYIKQNFYPQDVFDFEELATWAEENGYEKLGLHLIERRSN